MDTLVGNTKTVPLVKTENIGTHTSVPNYEWGRCVLAAACVDFHQVSLYTFFTAGVGRERAMGDPVDVERRRGAVRRGRRCGISRYSDCAPLRARLARTHAHTHTRNRTENQNEYFFGAFWFVLNFFRFFHVDFFTACRFLHLLLLLLLLLIYQGTETKRLGLLPG